MTGSPDAPKQQPIVQPSPTAMPIRGREEKEAKKILAARRGRGRESTRFAGLLNTRRQENILKDTLG